MLDATDRCTSQASGTDDDDDDGDVAACVLGVTVQCTVVAPARITASQIVSSCSCSSSRRRRRRLGNGTHIIGSDAAAGAAADCGCSRRLGFRAVTDVGFDCCCGG